MLGCFNFRPTQPLTWWLGDGILGGRDGQAGGTWLAATRNGRVALLTNFRELQTLPDSKSRGRLPVLFLEVIYCISNNDNALLFSLPMTLILC